MRGRLGARAVVVVALGLLSLAPARLGAAPLDEAPTGAYRVTPAGTRDQRTAIAGTGAGIDEIGDDYVIAQATPEERAAIEQQGFRAEELLAPNAFPARDAAYHDHAEVLAELQATAAAHPATVHRISLGSSYQGRDLAGVRISDDATENPTEPGVFFVGGHHGREHLSVEVALAVLQLFAGSTDPAVESLVTNRQIYVVPNLNPDGTEHDHHTGTGYQGWRKNRQPNPGTTAIGTDLNRNYGYKWGCCGGSSGSAGSATYRGSAPFSAPETTAVRDFIVARPHIMTAIAYHSYDRSVLYPYGYTTANVPDDMTSLDRATFVAIAREIARTTGYKAKQASDLYILDGDFGDWFYGARRRYGVTVELGPDTFYPGPAAIETESARNLAGARYMAEIADCPIRVAGGSCGPPPPGGVANGDFESALSNWTASGAVAVSSPVHGGAGAARLGGADDVTHKLSQKLVVPAGGQLTLWVRLDGTDTTAKDKLKVIVKADGTKTVLGTVTSTTPHGAWQLVTLDASAFAGQQVTLLFTVSTNGAAATSFHLDDVALG